MHEAGAKFGGICLIHHDGFALWDSKVNRWNSATMGPKRDIYGEIAAAVRKHDDMKLLATFHHGRSFGYTTGAMKDKDITEQMRKSGMSLIQLTKNSTGISGPERQKSSRINGEKRSRKSLIRTNPT